MAAGAHRSLLGFLGHRRQPATARPCDWIRPLPDHRRLLRYLIDGLKELIHNSWSEGSDMKLWFSILAALFIVSGADVASTAE